MNSLSLLIRVLLGFGLAFIAVPLAVLPRPKSARNMLDVIVINFIRWVAVVMVGVQLLASLRLFETVTITGLCLTSFWYFKLRPRGWTLARTGSVLHEGSLRVMDRFDVIEHSGIGRKGSRRRLTGVSEDEDGGIVLEDEPVPARVRRPLSHRLGSLAIPLALAAPLLAVLVWSFLQRLDLPLHNVTLSPPDAYVHMTWAKGLVVNSIFPDGIYPMGMASFIAFLSKFCFRVDMADVTRFVGPITGMLIVFGLFYTALRLTRNPGAAVLAAGTFGLFGARPEWHEPWIRQIGPLPQELALGLSILGLAFAGLAVARRDRDHLITVGATTVVLSLTHPVPLVSFLALAAVLAFSIGVFVRGGIREAVLVCLVAGGGAAAGLLFIPIAYLAGVKLYAGLKDFNPLAGRDPAVRAVVDQIKTGAVGHNLLSKLAAISSIVGFVGGVSMVIDRRLRTLGAQIIGFSVVAATIVALYDVRWLGLDSFYAGRVANIVGPQLALSLAAGFAALGLVFRRKFSLGRAGILLGSGILALIVFGAAFPGGIKEQLPIEYNATALVTRSVKVKQERLTYTLVGTPEQRQVVLGDGFHVESWVFARDVSLRDARDPGWEVPIPTDAVYITVEKNPFKVVELPPRGATEEYYRNQKKRARIMTIIYRWSETYRKYHDDMTIFYDDANVRVYEIDRTPDVKGDEDGLLFKDPTYKPRELFNDGPTVPTQVVIL